MNERIKELAHEAGLPTYNPEGIPTKLEKFAELIVAECVAMADDFECDVNQSGLVDRMKQHFGIDKL